MSALQKRPALISLVIAFGVKDGVMGKANQLPWDIPEDLAHFKKTTLGKTIIMGRKTFEGMGRALPKRRNIVITRDAGWSAEKVEAFANLEGALAACAAEDEVFIIGGAELIKTAWGLIDRVVLTEVEGNYAGDVFFPHLQWRERFAVVSQQLQTSAAGIRFTIFEGIKKSENRSQETSVTEAKQRLLDLNSPSADSKNYAVLLHLSVFSGFFIPLLGFVAPVILWILKKDQSEFIDHAGKETLNFMITFLLVSSIVWALCFVLVGFILVPVVLVWYVVSIIVAAVRTSKGVAYRFPHTLRLLS